MATMTVSLIKHPEETDWKQAKLRALVTVGKSKVINAPTEDWKRSILRARHSPIRFLSFSFYFEGLPSYIATHFVRHHVGVEKYVKSQRNDRQADYDRRKAPQDAPVNMIMDFNAESLIVFMQKRLCCCADPNTRKVVEEMKELVLLTNPEFEEFLKKPCEYYGKCFEMKSCGFHK